MVFHHHRQAHSHRWELLRFGICFWVVFYRIHVYCITVYQTDPWFFRAVQQVKPHRLWRHAIHFDFAQHDEVLMPIQRSPDSQRSRKSFSIWWRISLLTSRDFGHWGRRRSQWIYGCFANIIILSCRSPICLFSVLMLSPILVGFSGLMTIRGRTLCHEFHCLSLLLGSRFHFRFRLVYSS